MIKYITRHVPSSLNITTDNEFHALGLKEGITYALSNLLHECDIIMRLPPIIEKECINKDDKIYKYKVRSRFTVKSKEDFAEKGKWINIHSHLYEEVKEIKNE